MEKGTGIYEIVETSNANDRQNDPNSAVKMIVNSGLTSI